MSETDVFSAVLAAGGVGTVLLAAALVVKQVPAIVTSIHAWHLDIKRLNLLKHQFDQTRRTDANIYLYPPTEPLSPEASAAGETVPDEAA